uniref:cytochrome c biogenesis protein CcsA n=1 Tax=Idiomarina sp. UBA3162 TaxID=1946641 RepID=UPI0025C544DC
MNIDRYFFRLLSAGTLLLILAIASGFAFLDDMFAQNQAHKTILAMAAALVYIITYLTHKATGLRGKPVMVLSILGTVLLTLGYFGSRFVKDIILS